ncbi:hypothetical protein LAZ67_X001171 [Cordylochernes scorpioides]|uniref:Integrase catalytic domain-containing protein n=1 Tax=Cordylochernes scorpioides TaxID=51811 RepID=A0ABY6LSN9_9ARAC|nr:hypothetical protein LAZ67_X001171 [Cordylochernes scorpioides]
MGVDAVNTTAWRPQSNGAVERLNRTIIESLRRCAAGSNWDNILPMIAFAIRTAEHSSTGFTPAKLIFGHQLSEDSINEMAAFYERELTDEVAKIREAMERFLIREGASDKQNQNENKEDKKIVKSTGNKRKYVEDYLKYGFIPSVNDPSLPFCLICQKTLSNETMVPSKLLRHIETNHREQMNNPISYFENIRSSFQKQSKKFKKFMTTSDEAQTASYMIAQLIARKKKAHAEAEEIILPALKIVAGCMLTNDAMEKVTKIPLSSKTIARRIEDMSEDIELQIKQSFNDSSTKWAIQLDETTDISNKAQLLAFLRFVDTEKIVNNYFFCKELKQRTTGADIFELVDENVMKYNLRWENCVSVCTDGAPAMKGSRKGLIAHVIKKSKYQICSLYDS